VQLKNIFLFQYPLNPVAILNLLYIASTYSCSSSLARDFVLSKRRFTGALYF
jgi:hypothetical protein